MDILVIDDSKFMRTWMRVNLQQAGYEVEETEPTSLFNLLEAIHRLRPALVLTDYEMPFCNGEALIQAIREDPVIQTTPVIVVSSHRDEALVNRLMQFDLAAYLLKPLSPEAMVQAVQEFLPQPTLG